MDIEMFVPNDKNILDELLNNQNDASTLEGGTEDFMKLEVNEQYKNNQERIKRERSRFSNYENLEPTSEEKNVIFSSNEPSYINLNEKKSID